MAHIYFRNKKDKDFWCGTDAFLSDYMKSQSVQEGKGGGGRIMDSLSLYTK